MTIDLNFPIWLIPAALLAVWYPMIGCLLKNLWGPIPTGDEMLGLLVWLASPLWVPAMFWMFLLGAAGSLFSWGLFPPPWRWSIFQKMMGR